MNALRRKELQTVISSLQELQCTLETICSDEQEYRDNIPENMLNSEKYDKANEAVDALELAVDGIENAVDYVLGAIEL
jgi:hypothetical protein